MTTGWVIGFILWLAAGALFIGIGLKCFKSKEPSGFWANAETAPIEDIPSYNRAMGKLWCAFGVGLMILGLPMLVGNRVWILVSCVGVMLETILVMMIYVLKIEGKYRKK